MASHLSKKIVLFFICCLADCSSAGRCYSQLLKFRLRASLVHVHVGLFGFCVQSDNKPERITASLHNSYNIPFLPVWLGYFQAWISCIEPQWLWDLSLHVLYFTLGCKVQNLQSSGNHPSALISHGGC